MKLFGIEIKRAKPMDDKVAQVSSQMWSPGLIHTTPDNYEAMVKAYRSWVYVCANKNSLAVAQQNLRLYVAKPTKTSKLLQRTKKISHKRLDYLNSLHTVKRLKSVRMSEEIEEVVEHPFLDLLQTVNPSTNQFDLWELSTVFQELTGNSYWYLVRDEILGTPKEIWIMPAQNIVIVPGKKEFIAGYVYKDGAKEVPFDVDEVVHFKYANPNDMFYGMAPLAAVTDAYNTNQNILNFTNSLFTNMARPEGVLSTDKTLIEEDFIRLKEQWHAAYGGTSKARKTAVLTKGLKYTPITMTPQELDYNEGRKIVKEEICNAYGQSLAMYSESANRSNSEQANLAFLRDTIQPRLRRSEEKINEQLMPLYDDSIFVAYDSPVPQDKMFRLKERESNIKSGYSSINLERQIDNQDEVEWGDIPLLPTSLQPIGSVPLQAAPKPEDKPEEDDAKFIVRQVIQSLKEKI